MWTKRALCFGLILLGLIALVGDVAAQEAVVQAVFFYSPTCGHCHYVMDEILPPLEKQYGSRLQILQIDTFTPEGQLLYESAMDLYGEERRVVPVLIVGDEVLIGSQEIPAIFPALIERYLDQGGVDWPAIPGLPTEDIEPTYTWRDKFARDPVGSTLAVLVLLGLVAAVVLALQPRAWQMEVAERFSPWGFVIVALVGMAVAGYLSYGEITDASVVCGPVGDCNAVQQSEYSELFGVLPMAILGFVGYIASLVAFIVGYRGQREVARYARAATFVFTLFGVLFSARLTFLEPFVIGAVCLWCLTTATGMGLLLLLSAGPGWEALGRRPRKRRSSGYTRRRASRKKR